MMDQWVLGILGSASVFLCLIGLLLVPVYGNTEGDALNALKTTLADPNNVLQSWDPTLVNPCTWFHVTCNSENSVTRVDLGNANLSGQLVPQLGQLSNLQYLELYSNNISGRIPYELGNLTNLVSLDLYLNKLVGPIPDTLGKLQKLRFLRLNNNSLTGQIPVLLTTVTSLQVLDLSNNKLTGPVPVKKMLLSFDSQVESPSSTYHDSLRSFKKNGMIELEERNKEHDLIKAGFLSGMGQLGKEVEVVAIHKNSCSTILGQARLESFRIYSEAMRKKCGGNANIKYAWFGSSKDEICNIISHGFSTITEPKSGECFGMGVHLYPANIHGVLSALEDENGLRHMLLCRVILGNTEIIEASSKQFQPTCQDFDSGVDNYLAPKTYIIWPSYMNSHILPNFLVSFSCTPSYLLGASSKIKKVSPKSNSRIKFHDLLRVLSKYLHPSRMVLISKYYEDFQKNKITKLVLVRKLRRIAGDTSLRAVMKLYPNTTI